MRAEFNAFAARVRGHAVLSNKTDTVVRLNTDGSAVRTNYVVLYPNVPDLDDRRYVAGQDVESSRRCRFDARVVAVDADGLMILAEALHAQLLPRGGVELTVPGRVCDRIRLLPGVEEGRVQYDRTARLFYLDETYEFWSHPA